MQTIYRLTKEVGSWDIGDLILLGEKDEYFNISIEISTGHSWSEYEIPHDHYTPASQPECKIVLDFLNSKIE